VQRAAAVTKAALESTDIRRIAAVQEDGMEKLSGEVYRALADMSKAKRMLAEARRKLGRLTQPSGSDHYLVEKEWQWAHELMEGRCEKILSYPNVVGYGLGFRFRKGERTDTPCLTVYVRKKVDERRMRLEAKLPKSVSVGKRRLPIDVIELGKLERQLSPGDSIGPDPLFQKGTLGAFARDLTRGDVVALTAMHVTPLRNFPVAGSTATDFQTPCPGNRFGRLRAGSTNGIDAAAVELTQQPASPQTVLPGGIGLVRGWRPTTFPGDLSTSVRIFGATSSFRMGTIRSPATSIPGVNLVGAILVDIFTQGGDSGCALVDPENLLLGFLVGRGSSQLNNLAVFTPASLVLSRLGCDIPSV
jgi:hypothetical protein